MDDIAYVEVTTVAEWPKLPFWKRAFTKLLFAIFPKANPDFEELYPNVRKWLLEIRLPEGLPLREVGLDILGKPIVAGPIGRNYGFWTDGPEPIEWQKYPSIESTRFEENWLFVASILS